MVQVITKDDLIEKLLKISKKGWIENARHGNNGGVGNTLEDLLNIKENNLPIANSAEWELKSHRIGSQSLVTLMHKDPSPQALRLVTTLLLPKYGWGHKEAGLKYGHDEKSFRLTINYLNYCDRGFKVSINEKAQRIEITFNVNKVDSRHKEWLENVKKNVGLGELNPQPYWGFTDLEHAAGNKLKNCFFVEALVKRVDGKEYYWYNKILRLKTFSFEGFLEQMRLGNLYVDFDARSGHNHGTKFRLRQKCLPNLYKEVTTIL